MAEINYKEYARQMRENCPKDHYGNIVCSSELWEQIASIIEKIPTADVAEVVRCKDCKFNVANMEKDPLDCTDYSGDDIVCSYFMTDGLDPNDYCSQGKRKEDR